MSMTWGDLKAKVRGLVYLDETETLDNEFMFPSFANDALVRISTDFPLEEEVAISHFPLENAIGAATHAAATHTSDDLIYTAENPVSYYFECDGTGSCVIETQAGTVSSTVSMSSSGKYVAYKGFMSGVSMQLRFTGSYAYNVRNVAMYKYKKSALVTDIPAYIDYDAYDIETLVAAHSIKFKEFSKEPIVRLTDSGVKEEYVDYRIKGETVVEINHKDVGEYLISYRRYPAEITSSTLTSYVMDITADAGAALVQYLGSLMLKDENLQYAIMCENKYERLIADAANRKKFRGVQRSKSTRGWC